MIIKKDITYKIDVDNSDFFKCNSDCLYYHEVEGGAVCSFVLRSSPKSEFYPIKNNTRNDYCLYFFTKLIHSSNPKDPFFKKTKDYPDLYPYLILFEYEFYGYYVLKDKESNYYLLHCYNVDTNQSWILNKINKIILDQLLKNIIDIRTAFNFGNHNKILIYISYETNKESYKLITNKELNHLDILPDEKVYLDVLKK